jgi:hypothetical protein
MVEAIALGVTQSLVAEHGGGAVTTFFRNGGVAGMSGVDDSAIACASRATQVALLTFVAGETKRTVSISVLTDTLPDGNESFAFDMAAVPGGTPGFPGTTRVIIRDGEAHRVAANQMQTRRNSP